MTVSFGAALFALPRLHCGTHKAPLGYILIMLALTADAALGNVQEKAIRTYSATNSEVVKHPLSFRSLATFTIRLSGPILISRWLRVHLHFCASYRRIIRRYDLFRQGK